MSDQQQSSKRRWGLIVAAVLAVLLFGIVLWLALNDADNEQSGSQPGLVMSGQASAPPSSMTPSASAHPSANAPTPSPTDAASQDVEAQEVATHALDAVAQAMASPQTTPDLSGVLTGAYLEAFNIQREEWENNQWTQSGSPTISNVKVLENTDNGTRLVTQMCVDSSTVKVLDENGVDVRSTTDAQRTLNIFTFVLENGTWRLSDQSFPEDPNC